MIAIASAPGGPGFAPDLLDQRRAIDQREPAALARKAEGHDPADALRRAGDDGDLAGKTSRKDHRRPRPVQLRSG